MSVLWVLGVLVICAWIIFTQVGGRQQLDVLSPYDVARTRELVNSRFGVAWSRVPGRGDDNFSPRLRAYTPTLSVSYKPASGGTNVSLWCSAYSTKMLVMAHAQLMWRKKRSVARALAQADSRSLSGAVPGLPRDDQV